MKALVCEQYGPPELLVLRDVPDPEPKTDEVLIQVRASSVNFPDTLIIQGKYQYRPDFPFSPGCEVAGDIVAVGSDIQDYKPGDRVVAFPGWGGFAELVAVPASVVSALPDSIDYSIGAAFLLTYATTYYAFQDRANLMPGESVLILGAAGGVGLAAVDIAKAMGAKVIAAASSQDKLDICREHGADYTLNYSDLDIKTAVRELSDHQGVDVIYDAVGGPYSETALRTMAWNGRYLVIGFASGEIPKIPLNLILLKNCSVMGVFWGEFTRRFPENNQQNIMRLLDMLKDGRIKPHVHARYSLAEGSQALRDLIDRRVSGKVVLDVS